MLLVDAVKVVVAADCDRTGHAEEFKVLVGVKFAGP
jgi:hypothetical protein